MASSCFYSQKIIPVKTCYKMHDAKLLAIVEAFKNWRHYLEGYQYKVPVLTNHNNLHQFMDMKSLSSCQVRWARSCSTTISASIITKARLIELLILYPATLSRVQARTKFFKLRIQEFFSICSLC